MKMVPQLRDQLIPLCHLVCEESYDGVLRQSAAMLCNLFNARDCVFFLLDGSGQNLVITLGVREGDAHWAPEQRSVNIDVDRTKGGPFSQVALTGKTLSGLTPASGYKTDLIQEILGPDFKEAFLLPLQRPQGELLGIALISGSTFDPEAILGAADLGFFAKAIGGILHRRVYDLARVRERHDLQKSLEFVGKDREKLRRKLSGELLEKFPGRSAAAHDLRNKISLLADFEGNISIFGPDGCGREKIAQEIHKASRWSRSAFVFVDCKDLTEDNFAPLMFGYKRGAIQGVSAARKGYLREAGEGMVYLHRVDLLPIDLQASLARVLEKNTYRALGAERDTPVSARFVFSAASDLPRRRCESEFIGSLFFKMTQSTIRVPSLSNRQEDIPDLAWAVTRRLSRKLRKPCSLSEETTLLLKSEPIEGEVRELENRLERAAARLGPQGGEIFPEHLAEVFEEETRPQPESSLSEKVASYERNLLVAALKENNFDRSLAAEALKIPKRTLADKCKKYHI